MKINKYYTYFIVFNLLLAIPPAIIQTYFAPLNLIIPYFWQLFGLFAVLTLIIHLLNHTGFIKGSKNSVKTFLGGTFIRFIVFMIVILAYTTKIQIDAPKFIGNFFYLYLFNTVFEIYCLLINLRNQN
ncbi:hypothetical protein BEL04_19870 [Mucilaginibacter sp. PPCGB 2223]|uniref:hypothetical protein n=1 Tax=Mucilaginibacter sp. PPCGB 2223 TaxID=1886027 RepID=UPI0008264A82|nr:hypothetical protein [Mucilaginibacter sp. PPCGB 2223]OCX50979.1 hypothetical protein BEL04_19870 [Mucilaginibacter sp. PPCGB 2223]